MSDTSCTASSPSDGRHLAGGDGRGGHHGDCARRLSPLGSDAGSDSGLLVTGGASASLVPLYSPWGWVGCTADLPWPLSCSEGNIQQGRVTLDYAGFSFASSIR